MKSKYYFVLFLILTTMFMLGAVAASENCSESSSDNQYLPADTVLTSDNSSADVQLSNDESDDKDLIGDSPTTSDGVDLSVNMELGDIVKNTYGINEITFDVPLIITAKVSGGIAKNTKIYLNIPEEFEYVSNDNNIGTYDSGAGIWDIGDLDSGVDASLTIFTKITKKGNYKVTVNATTTSNDVNLTNNNIICNIQVSSKITSNTTRTTADSSGARHDSHYGSDPGGNFRKEDDDNQQGNDNPSTEDSGKESAKTEQNDEPATNGDDSSSVQNSDSNSGSGSNGQTGSDSNSKSSGSSLKSTDNAKKQIDTNIITKTADTISDTINNIFNPDPNSNDDEDSVESSGSVKAINVYNYTHIPVIIFVLFFVILIGYYAYDKIKS